MTGAASDPKPAKEAPAPFNKATADAILRSSDLVNFRVRKAILAEGSPFFEDMFTLPPLPDHRKRKGLDDQEYSNDGLPIISVSEDHATLENILLFCYPYDDPVLGTAQEVCSVLEAARKYLMDAIIKRIESQLLTIAHAHPISLYVIAAERRWDNEMRIAAKASLRSPLPDHYFAELEAMTAGDYFRLQEYHKACANAALAAFRPDMCYTYSWINTHWVWFQCKHAPSAPERITLRTSAQANIYKAFPVAQWFMDYLQAAQTALVSRPRGKTVSDDALVYDHVARGMRACSSCQSEVRMHLKAFAAQYALQVEELVSKVRLQIKV